MPLNIWPLGDLLGAHLLIRRPFTLNDGMQFSEPDTANSDPIYLGQ